ncbi:MAG: ABC transporter permease [Verrucomicrobia bacterium]|nr:ABC transporter permease [Verrucomicrobiota bacterium]
MQTREGYEIEIRPRQDWLQVDWQSLVEFRDLFLLFVRRDFVVKYKQTLLGPLWFVIQPLLTTVVFAVVFGGVAKIPTGGIPPMAFYLSGLTVWAYFSQCVSTNATTFLSNANLFSKVFFPRLIVPLSTTVSNLFALAVQLISLIGFILYFKLSGAALNPSAFAIVTVPLVILQSAVLALGFGLLFASFTAKYQDLIHLIGFGLQIWMYASPIIYPASNIPARYAWLIWANPVAPVIENFRAGFLGTPFMPPLVTAWSIVLAVSIFFAGLFQYQRAERTFIDTV